MKRKNYYEKRILTFLLAIVVSAGLLTNYAYAISVEQAPCYVSSPECPQGYIDYVNENITKFLIAAEENQATESCYVGTPFAFNDSNSDVFYFPVIQGNDIKYLLRVYPIEDGYSGIISEFLVREINSLPCGSHSISAPYCNL